MTILLQDIQTHLINKGLVSANNCFIDYAPDCPENIIVIYGYGSRGGSLTGISHQSRNIQIMARNKIALDAINLLNSIYNELIPLQGCISINNRRCFADCISDASIIKEENNLFHYGLNINITTYRD